MCLGLQRPEASYKDPEGHHLRVDELLCPVDGSPPLPFVLGIAPQLSRKK